MDSFSLLCRCYASVVTRSCSQQPEHSLHFLPIVHQNLVDVVIESAGIGAVVMGVVAGSYAIANYSTTIAGCILVAGGSCVQM
jgi:hypothetical protein